MIESLPHKMPHVAFLRTCKQVDREATPILYGKNIFFVALPKIGAPYDPTASFLWYMRKSTIPKVASITFLHGCYCPGWLIACSPIRKPVAAKQWTATGKQLSKLYFPHYSLPHWMPLGKNAREAYEHICRKILEDKTATSTGFICSQCRNQRKNAFTLKGMRDRRRH
ncbi:hypothetical protein GGS26DRAFT_337945 [Hypomontagnella submonticulosa]|nr:hypothetical protein GGS26DRAFT_337945 [Hypomontagnella submonticulosa]